MTDRNPYTAPASDVMVQRLQAAPLTTRQMLFGTVGRIRRRDFWLWAVGSGFSFGLVAALLVGLIGLLYADSTRVDVNQARTTTILTLVVPVYAVLLWVSTALQIKRWHDRGKSGWWCLLGLVPLLNLWAMIELGFMAGMRGSNEYGADPKATTTS